MLRCVRCMEVRVRNRTCSSELHFRAKFPQRGALQMNASYHIIIVVNIVTHRHYPPENNTNVYYSILHIKKVKQSRYTPWRRLGERRYSSYSFLTWALDGVSGQHHAPAALYPGERTPGIHCTGRWVGPRAGLGRKNLLPLPGIEPRSPGRPARSQTLYCLS
jgi:hypothetical protein